MELKRTSQDSIQKMEEYDNNRSLSEPIENANEITRKIGNLPNPFRTHKN
jgi:hypothetical protein